jgi:hypothetical protein
MTIAARLTSIGTFFAYDYDETVVTKFRIGSDGTAYSNEFDENTSTTLSGTKRMSVTSLGNLIVLDSINEIDPFITTVPTTGLQLNIDPAQPPASETLPVGQQAYTTAQTTTFTVPNGCTSISAVCIGGGGGGGGSDSRSEGTQGGAGGALCYGTIAVTPGEQLTIVVGSGGNGGGSGNDGSNGGNTSISRGATALLTANGGSGGNERSTGAVGAATYTVNTTFVTSSGGGNGGGCNGSSNSGGAGGGGAGGYSGNGGTGGGGTTGASAGQGGGSGGGGHTTSGLGAGGGGTGILGSGSNGAAGTSGATPTGGGRGSYISGSFPTSGTRAAGGAYGGGGGGYAANANGSGGNGGVGAVRIIWGTGRSYPSTSVADATVVNYAFTLSDLSGNSRTASAVNGASRNASLNGGVVVYDGTNDYMTVTSYKGVTGTGARTSIVWFKASVPNTFDRIMGWGATTAAGNKWGMEPDSTTFKLHLSTSNGAYAVGGSTTPNIMDGKWHMIAASVGASQTVNDIKLYVDGNLLTDVTRALGATAINTSSSADVSFGASLADASPEYLNGHTSQVLIYNVQLSDLEIKQVHRTILNRF